MRRWRVADEPPATVCSRWLAAVDADGGAQAVRGTAWVVQRLGGDDLRESCEYLVDNFAWRNKQLSQSASRPMKMLAAAKKGLTITKARPVTLEE